MVPEVSAPPVGKARAFSEVTSNCLNEGSTRVSLFIDVIGISGVQRRVLESGTNYTTEGIAEGWRYGPHPPAESARWTAGAWRCEGPPAAAGRVAADFARGLRGRASSRLQQNMNNQSMGMQRTALGMA